MNLKILFVGDTGIFEDSPYISPDILQQFSEAEFRICNLEAPIISGRLPSPIPKRGPSLYQKSNVLSFLKECGFTHCSLANNHMLDYGYAGLCSTLNALHGYTVFGAAEDITQVYLPAIVEKHGLRIGLFAIAENGFGAAGYGYGGYALYDTPQCLASLHELRKQVDFLVILFHAGLEEVSFPLPEWKEIYHRYCDMGADAIIAHHPHVPQGIEYYKNSLIVYSLGNFYFDRMPGKSYSIICNFEKDKKITYRCIPHISQNHTIEPTDLDLDELNLLLANAESKADEIAVDMLKNIYIPYLRDMYFYKDTPSWKRDVFWRIYRHLISNKLEVITDSELLWLYHNINIDTHRFIQTRALNHLYRQTFGAKIEN